MTEVIVRYPPSPTGPLHVGTVRVMLYNYVFAKQHNGKIVMRLEDTDRERSTKESEENILSGLKNMGITWDGEVHYQSKRIPIYRKYLEQLLNEEKAYYCFCTKEELETERLRLEGVKLPPRYSGKCAKISKEEQEMRVKKGEKGVIRFRTPESEPIIFEDHIRGKVEINAKEIDDFVIAKNLDEPLYNFCVVVDDHEMNISHVIRGEDHISNTPKQILIYEAFSWKIPEFAHLPLILNEDKSKLSKRKNKVSVDDYLAEGYLKEALLNFLALLGWNTSDENEIFSLEDLIREFSLERVHKGGAVFDLAKLLHVNGVWIRKKTPEEFKNLAEQFLQDPIFVEGRKKYGEKFYETALELVHERTKKLNELPDFLRFFFVDDLKYSKELFFHEKMKVDENVAKTALEEGKKILEGISESDWNEENIKEELLVALSETSPSPIHGWKNGQLLWPLRVALSGEAFSPGTFELLAVFGKERSLGRIEYGTLVLNG
ncbi:glutamate--tRNA ligase [Candidatus Peregrinibacteria bacterium]|nr:glutamate--tRNA ligase [Candidatus Peregrinibacteria bacterium]